MYTNKFFIFLVVKISLTLMFYKGMWKIVHVLILTSINSVEKLLVYETMHSQIEPNCTVLPN